MIKQFFSSFLALIVFFGFLAGVIALILVISLRDSPPKVDDGSVLVLNLNQPISDKPISIDPRAYAEQLVMGGVSSTFTLRELLAVINHAAEDDRISGIYLTGGVPTGGTYYSGLAQLNEVRDALQNFRDTGKPIYAYNTSWNMRSYYLASVADSVFVHPMGSVNIPGFSISRTFYKDALDRFGVDIYVARQSDYKSALEPYFRSEMSDEDREQRMLIMERNYSHFAETIASARGLTPEEVSGMSADPELLRHAETGLKYNLVDDVIYYDTILDKLKAFTGVEEKDEPFTQVSYSNYRSNVGNKIFEKGDGKIALIYAEGGIVGGSGTMNVAGDYVSRLLRQARNNDDIDAVVLRVNSPGGGVTPSEVILREMQLLSEVKPVVVSMGNLAASGGYWISSYADYIFAQPTTLTGSIGIYSMFPVYEDLASEYGVSFDGAKTHPFADLRSSERNPTDEEWSIIQAGIDHGYQEFLNRVSEGRKLEMDHVEALAKGRVWSGTDALELGLVDEIGGLHNAIRKAGELAEIESWEITTYQRAEDFRDRFLRFFGTSAEAADPVREIPAGIREITNLFELIRQLDDPNHTYARMPHDYFIK